MKLMQLMQLIELDIKDQQLLSLTMRDMGNSTTIP